MNQVTESTFFNADGSSSLNLDDGTQISTPMFDRKVALGNATSSNPFRLDGIPKLIHEKLIGWTFGYSSIDSSMFDDNNK